MSEIERRALMKGAALSALAFTVGGAQVLLSPREARAQNIPFRTLTPEQAETLEALGETLVPGAQAAGIAHFVDQQLSVPPEEALLEARILNVRPPYANFYRAALGAIDRASHATNDNRGFCPAQRERAPRLRRPDAPEQDRRLARPAGTFRLSGDAQRRRRRRLRHHGRLRRARHSLHGPHRADEEVVTWQH